MTGQATSNNPRATHADSCDDDGAYCPFFQHALEVVGRRWSGSILKALAGNELRFGEIRSLIPGLSDRLLDTRLTELLAEDIVERIDRDDIVRYRLSQRGADLEPVFVALTHWCHRHAPAEPAQLPGRRRC